MERILRWIKLIVTSDSGISSKRVCGVLGFLVISFVLIYCAICCLLAPLMIDTFIWAVCVLLGIDTLISPFSSKYKNSESKEE